MDTEDDGVTTLKWADELDLDDWLKEYSLDELWQHRSSRSAVMKVAILVEGKTELAFKTHLVAFLRGRLEGNMPRLDPFPYHGRIPTEAKLRRAVNSLLAGPQAADAVIALSDVYTGTGDFVDASDAKRRMREWVGSNERFFPHVAQHDFEAWLLPYWSTIQRIAGHNRRPPGWPSGEH